MREEEEAGVTRSAPHSTNAFQVSTYQSQSDELHYLCALHDGVWWSAGTAPGINFDTRRR